MFSIQRGIEHNDSEGYSVSSVPMFPGVTFPSLDAATDALHYISKCMNCKVVAVSGGLFKHVLGVQSIYSQEANDGNKQQKSTIVLIRRLTT